jgi:hypothetical protein
MKNNSVTQMFRGMRIIRKKVEGKLYSMPSMPPMNLTKNLYKSFKKTQILTQLQYDIVKEQLERCTEKTSPEYIAILCALLEKPVADNKEEKKNKL